jgi:hypothetical protein
VELGSADAEALHWDGLCDSACDLFFAIDWKGVCMPIPGPKGATYPPCQEVDWVTVIDAHTGTFIVGGG